MSSAKPYFREKEAASTTDFNLTVMALQVWYRVLKTNKVHTS